MGGNKFPEPSYVGYSYCADTIMIWPYFLVRFVHMTVTCDKLMPANRLGLHSEVSRLPTMQLCATDRNHQQTDCQALSCGVDVRVCACEVLSFRTTIALQTLTHISTYTCRHTGISRHAECALVLSCIQHLLHQLAQTDRHIHENTHIFGCIFISKLVISDHFCNFHLSLDCFPFECHSWPGHVLHHASDMKSCFRLTFLYVYIVSSHIYICTKTHTYTLYTPNPRKQKPFSAIWIFSGFCLSKAESWTHSESSTPHKPHMQVFMVRPATHICVV